MNKITGKELEKLIPLYDKQGIEESLTEAVLKGVVKGWAHVDDAAHPSMALVMQAHVGGIFWLGDQPGEDIAEDIVNDVFLYQSDREICTWIEFGNCPENIMSIIEARVEKPYKTGRICFMHDREVFQSAPEPSPNEGITISLYSRGDDLPEEVRMESMLFWDEQSEIIHDSVAAVAHDAQGKLCGICIPAAVVEGSWEIDIGTGEEYRRKGVGYATAHAFIKECLSRGCIPRWNCRRDNTASYNLAIKLGFKPVNGYEMISWDRQNEKMP